MSSTPLYQLTFSDQSLKQLEKLESLQQMELMDRLSQVQPQSISKGADSLGRFQREGVIFYRLRVADFRIYFEIKGEIIHCHYILPQHSLSDFIFRFKLPVSEEQMVEQHQSFWKYLDSLK